jgi:RecA/RadA recombinase
MSTTSLFDTITSEAAIVAAAPVVTATATGDLNFSDYSDRREPSAGFLPQLVRPATKDPHGYQWAAVESILLHGKAVVGFEPGMGKTLVAMTAVANLVAQGRKAVICVPPSLRIDPWERGFALDFPEVRTCLLTGRETNEKKPSTVIAPDADVVIIGDSVLAARVEDLADWGASVFVVDEAHRMKNPKAGRAKGMLRLVDDAYTAAKVARELGKAETHPEPVVAMLTGTLAVNRPDEVYQPIRIAGRELVRSISVADSYEAFTRKWCVQEHREIRTKKGKISKAVNVGCKDPEGLHQALRDTCYLRTRREDVLDMPIKVWAVRGLDLGRDAMRQYRIAEENFIAWVMEQNGAEAAARAQKAEAINKMNKLWALAGSAKAEAAAEYVADLVEQGEQVVVMMEHQPAVAAFHDAIRKHTVRDGIRTRAIRTVEVIGGMGERRKVEAADAFKAGKCEVLIGSLKAASEGLNLGETGIAIPLDVTVEGAVLASYGWVDDYS